MGQTNILTGDGANVMAGEYQPHEYIFPRFLPPVVAQHSAPVKRHRHEEKIYIRLIPNWEDPLPKSPPKPIHITVIVAFGWPNSSRKSNMAQVMINS